VLFSLFPLFSQGVEFTKVRQWWQKCLKNLGGYLGVNGRHKRTFVDYVDKSNILVAANIHAASRHLCDLYGVANNTPGGTTNQKVASSSLAGRTLK
jgi:hypothetical protein